MHKDIFAAPIWGDEAKTLVGVVPLHRPNLLNRDPIGRGIVCGSLWSGTPRLLLRRGARIHAEDLRHLRPLRTRAGTHLECRAGRHAAVATALNYAHMEECIAGTIGQLDEAEAFVRVVPLDSSSNGRAGGAVELWTARRSISEIASWWLVVVSVEITAAARRKSRSRLFTAALPSQLCGATRWTIPFAPASGRRSRKSLHRWPGKKRAALSRSSPRPFPEWRAQTGSRHANSAAVF